MILSARRRVGRMLWLSASALVAAGTLTPSDQPAVGAAFCVICGDFAAVDMFLNVAAFAPIGAGLALEGLRFSRAIPIAIAASLAIEILQLFWISGRDASIADVFSNSLGAVIGFALAARAMRWIRPEPLHARELAAGWLVLWLGVQAIGAYALWPDPTSAPYHGQIARALSGHPGFPGQVIEPRVHEAPLPDHVMSPPQAARLRTALTTRVAVRVDATVVVDTPPSWQSSIVRVADGRENEILVVASQRQDLVASMRTKASRLRLRPLGYRLDRAFVAAGDRARIDTTQARVTFAPDRVELEAATAGDRRAVSIPLTPASFWRLFTPMMVYADNSRRYELINAAWMLLTILPLGYWWYLGQGAEMRRHAAATIVLAGGIGTGWLAIPAIAGVALFTPAETFATLAGFAAGVLLARTAR